MKLGELARRAGVGVETVRFYQRKGLLGTPVREPGRTRDYPPEVLADLCLIRRCVGLGLTLAQTEALMRLRRTGRAPCSAAHDLLHEGAACMREERRVLDERIAAIERLLSSCANAGPVTACALLKTLEQRA